MVSLGSALAGRRMLLTSCSGVSIEFLRGVAPQTPPRSLGGGTAARRLSATGVIFPLDVSLQLIRIEVHLPQIAGSVARSLVVEVARIRMTADPAGCDRARAS